RRCDAHPRSPRRRRRRRVALELTELRAVAQKSERPRNRATFRLFNPPGGKRLARAGLMPCRQHAPCLIPDGRLHEGEVLIRRDDFGFDAVVAMVMAKPEHGVGNLQIEAAAFDGHQAVSYELRHLSHAVIVAFRMVASHSLESPFWHYTGNRQRAT